MKNAQLIKIIAEAAKEAITDQDDRREFAIVVAGECLEVDPLFDEEGFYRACNV
jgi:hypothetical protein